MTDDTRTTEPTEEEITAAIAAWDDAYMEGKASPEWKEGAWERGRRAMRAALIAARKAASGLMITPKDDQP